MQKHISIINRIAVAGLFFIIAFAACRPAKKVQRIGEVITSKDTASAVAVASDTAANKIDSAQIIRNIIDTLSDREINFKTFAAKVKMDYDGSEGNGQATVYLRMQKDSIIWLSLTGAFGIEGFRVIITKDSVKLMNKLDKVVQFRTIKYLQELTHVPIDFDDMQHILIGNPIYLDSNIVSYKYSDDAISILMAGSVFKNLLTLDKNSLLILHSKLDDMDPSKNRTADITYSNYDKVNAFYFSTMRKISVAEKAKLDINLEFKQYTFDQPQTFPFNIPKNYKSK
jgi:hypothetical protein